MVTLLPGCEPVWPHGKAYSVQVGKQWDLSWVGSALLMFLFKSCGQWTPSCVSRFGLVVRPSLPTETLSLIAAHLNAEVILVVTV